MRLSDIAAEQYEYEKSLFISPQTLQGRKSPTRMFLSFLATVHSITTARDLSAEAVHSYQRHVANRVTRNEAPLRPGSINHRINVAKKFLRFAHERGYLPRDLSTSICYVNEPRTLPTSVLTHDQARALLDAIDTTTALGHRNRTILELFYSCGIRHSELRMLNVHDIDIANSVLRVMGKGAKERTVPIGRTALTYLKSYLRAVRPLWVNANTTSALFLSRFGNRLSSTGLNDMVLRTARSDSVRVTPHTFRRSCATELIRNNAGLYHVKELLGHEDLSTLNPYVRLTITDIKRTHAACHPRERDER